MTWRFDWITSWDEIWADDFVSQWQKWLEYSPTAHVFFHPALVRAWVDTYLPLRDIQPRFVIAKKKDKVVFFPLVLWKKNWKSAFQRVLIPVGYSDYDYNDPIVVGNIGILEWNEFWERLQFNIVSMRRNWKFDQLIIESIRHGSNSESTRWQMSGTYPTIHIETYKKVEDYIESLSKSNRKALKRKLRRLQELGEIDYKVLSDASLGLCLSSFETMNYQHSKRWPNAYKASGFHKSILINAFDSGILHFSALTLERSQIAWQLSFLYHHRYYAYMPAFDDNYSRYSTGRILLLKCIEECIRLQCLVFDLLRGEESYKCDFANTQETTFGLTYRFYGPGSFIRNTFVDVAKPFMRSLLQRG